MLKLQPKAGFASVPLVKPASAIICFNVPVESAGGAGLCEPGTMTERPRGHKGRMTKGRSPNDENHARGCSREHTSD